MWPLLKDNIQQLRDYPSYKAFSPEWAEAANEGAGENQSRIRAWIKLRLAEIKWVRRVAAMEENKKHTVSCRNVKIMDATEQTARVKSKQNYI